MKKPWNMWTRTWKPLGGRPERTGLALSKRALAALGHFSMPEEVTIAKLFAIKGVGRKTVREISEVFQENGYSHLEAERRDINGGYEQYWSQGARAVRRAMAAEKNKAAKAARQAVVDAAVAAWPHIEKHLGGKKIKALGRAIATLDT